MREARRGINLGGDTWADARPYELVRQAGFDAVRLPVEWSAHTPAAPPHTVDPGFFRDVDDAIERALALDLDVVLDVHHFDELSDDADAQTPRFLALWSQIAERYSRADRRLAFELLNEPHAPLGAERWNELLAAALECVRASNPERTVIAGPVRWNTVGALPTLRLPDDDHLTVTVHYYSPFRFTHQGAGWLEDAGDWVGTSWGTDAERARVRADLEGAAAWARERGRPLFLGEFGAIAGASLEDRAAWTALVRSEAERHGLSWAYWDLATDFAAFDAARGAWQAPIRDALLRR